MQEVLNTKTLRPKAIIMQTAEPQAFFLQTVGQLAKTPCPTLKLIPHKGKTVGRHQKNLHEDRKKVTISKKTEINPGKPRIEVKTILKNVNLKKSAIFTEPVKETKADKQRREAKRRLMQLEVFTSLIKELTPKIKIKDRYWYSQYNNTIRDQLNEADYLLLRQLIRSFAILNSQNRTQTNDNTYEVSEQDYLFAFRLLKWKNKALKRKIKAESINFIDRIEWFFGNEIFTVREVQQKLKIRNIERIREYIRHYVQEGTIERKNFKLRLITKSIY